MNEDSDDSNAKERALRKPSRIWRTLLGAAIGALVAMAFVPRLHHGYGAPYRLIFDTPESINIPQLVLNVLFAAVLCALAANLSRRGVYLVAACLGIAAVAVGVIALVRFQEAAINAAVARARSDERYADQLLQFSRFQSPLRQQNVERAKQYLAHAAENWHLAGNAPEEQRLKAKEKNVEKPLSASEFFGSPPASRDQGMRDALPPEVDFSDLVPKQTLSPAPAKDIFDRLKPSESPDQQKH
jgi:hypothetical protein